MKSRYFLWLAFSIALHACQSNHSHIEPHTPVAEQDLPLQDIVEHLVSDSPADIGVAIIGPDHDTVMIHGNKPYKMQSVAKFPQALKLLKLVDEGKYPADYHLKVTDRDIKQRTYSTLLKDHPDVPFELTIREALEYSVGQSDNVTSNMIFDLDGGPREVESFVHGLGIRDMGINVDYWHLNDSTAYYNWSTPLAMARLLDLYDQGKILSPENHQMLWQVMANGPSGKNRLRGKLPEDVVVAHKTGTGNTDGNTGRIMALNDVGIIELPDHRHIVIAVFVSDSFAGEEATASLIADIGKAAYDYYLKKKQ